MSSKASRSGGRAWRRNLHKVGGAWVVNPKRACVFCAKDFRACSCGDTRPCPLDLEVA
jgi:hypothetical protein